MATKIPEIPKAHKKYPYLTFKKTRAASKSEHRKKNETLVIQQVCKVHEAVYLNCCIFKDLSAQSNRHRRALMHSLL